MLLFDGHARIGTLRLQIGEAVFLQEEDSDIDVGAEGMTALLAYPGPYVNPDALKEKIVTGIDATRHGSSLPPSKCAEVDHSRLGEREVQT